jgi:uncharacterized protein YkwD
MAFPVRIITTVLLLIGVAVGFALLASPSVQRAGAASACKESGDARPEKLTNGQARDAVLCLINRQRDQAGLPSLDRNRTLQKAAQRDNSRMRGSGCFSHQCPGEGRLEGRLRSAGYLGDGLRRWAYGENVAWGSGGRATPSAIVAAWMNSAGHRANILSSSFREIGVGFDTGTPGSKGASGGTYTVDFGLAVG